MADDDNVARMPRAFVPDLAVAVRRARLEEVERSHSAADLRTAAVARLEALGAALAPVFAQTGLHASAFDHGIAPVDPPRLFIDMIAFVDCGHDRKRYRFVQDTRDGPVVLAEDEDVEPIVEAVTMYVARRIVERERAMAAASSPKPAASATSAPPADARFGEIVTLYLIGALSGAAVLYALFRLGVAH